MDIDGLLADLGRRTGLGELRPNADGVCRVRFDDRVNVDIEAVDDGARVHVYTVVCPLPRGGGNERLYQALLEDNLFGEGTGGAVFAVDQPRGEVLLFRTFAPATTRYEEFEAGVESLVEHAERWLDRIDKGEFAAASAGPDEVPALPSPAEAPVIIRG